MDLFQGKGRSVKYDKSPKRSCYVSYVEWLLLGSGGAIRWRLGRIDMHVVYTANERGESLIATQTTFCQIKGVNQGPHNTFPFLRLYDGMY